MKEITPIQSYAPIPAPIPDTGFRPTLAPVPDVQASETTTTSFTQSATSSKAHLPSLFTASFSATQPPTLLPSPTRLSLSTAVSAASPLQPRSLSSTVIALLAVGSACLVLLFFIVIRSCTRQKRRPRLTPSLPILDDEYLEDLESKESPIFGGKERLSPKIDSWITLDPCFHNSEYSTLSSALSRPARAAKFGTGTNADVSRSPRPQEKASYSVCMSTLPYSRADHDATGSSFLEKRATSTYQAPYQQVQKAITQTIKRLSTMSSSLYPGTPLHNCEVGIALGGQETPLTGDGYSVMARSRVKSLKSKDYQIGQSHALAYDAVECDSTSTVVCEQATTAPPSSAQGGRTRIKSSYYAPGIYSRISAIPTSMTTPTTSMKALRGQAMEKPEFERDKNRRSLTRALGLASPSVNEAPLSPFTIYPDDSSSVLDHKEDDGATNLDHLPSPLTSDPGVTLGTLLLSDELHSRDKSASPLCDILTSGLRLESGKNPSHESRIHDKPPRVPSPPPLPSLAQMAMEHHNREGFENYRSPTYSIYGLYGGDRKSFGGLYK